MDVTKDILTKNDFEYIEGAVEGASRYSKFVPLKPLAKRPKYKAYYHLEIYEDMSNIPFREWHVHVDNEFAMTTGALDFQTVEQFNTFMDLLDINFQIKT